MKTLLFFLSTLLGLNSFSQTTSPKPLRHFSQAGPSPAGETQYGNNPQAGHYVQAGVVFTGNEK